jgi:hypothetical protein
MGRQYGQLMRAEINAFIPSFLTAAQADNPNLNDANLDAAWDSIIASYAANLDAGELSRFEDELNGVAIGAGLYTEGSADESGLILLRRANMIPVLSVMSGTSVAAVRTATSGGRTFQSNSIDWSLALGLQSHPCIVLYVPGIGYGFPHFNVTFAGLVGALTGVNLGGVGVTAVQDPDLAGDPLLTPGATSHLALFRDVLYDNAGADNVYTQTISAYAANALRLMRRNHLVFADGRDLREGYKFKIGFDTTLGQLLANNWNNANDNEFGDARRLLDVVYSVSDPAKAPEMYSILQPAQAAGALDQLTLTTLNSALSTPGRNLLNVVYGSADDATLDVWANYANGAFDASTRQTIHLNMQSYLP